MTSTFSREADIAVARLAGNIGAEISGCERQVVVAQRFGKLMLGHPTYGGPEGRPLMREMDSRGEGTRTVAGGPPASALTATPLIGATTSESSPGRARQLGTPCVELLTAENCLAAEIDWP